MSTALAACIATAAVAAGTAAAADPPPVWTLCANEGQMCAVTGTAQVRYGANGTFLYRTVTDTIACTNAAFGSDPVPWVVKRCEVGPPPTAVDAPWSASGAGASVTSDGTSSDAVLDYSVTGSSGAWAFSATAKYARQQPVDWRYEGYHAWYQVRVAIEKFVIRNGTEIVSETLHSAGPINCCAAPSGGFDYTGTTTFDLQPGDVYGFRTSGSHFDSDRRLIGTLALTVPVVLPPEVESTVARIEARDLQLAHFRYDLAAATVAGDTLNMAQLTAQIANGEALTNVDLIRFQAQLAQNSLTISIVSSIIKERGETLKSVAQKF